MTAPFIAPSGQFTESSKDSDVMFLGWYCADTTLTVAEKIAAAARRFAEKHGREATICLCCDSDAEAAHEEQAQDATVLPGVRVEARGYIARNTFYVGAEGEPA